jgi:hypothetical protein
VERLSSDALTERVSLMVRGVRPTAAELDLAAADPTALASLVDTWMLTPEFGETVRDMHAEMWGLRIDGEDQWPPTGPAAVYTQAELAASLGEEPLMHVEDVITSGRPYTDVLLSGEIMADEIVSVVNGVEREPGEGWTHGHYTDGRPAAGVLGMNAMWRRYTTNMSGKHRQRGLFVAQRLLCDDLRARDFPVVPLDEINSEQGMNNAVGTNPNCLACHATLDPLAAFFWGFEWNLKGDDISDAYDAGCEGSSADLCYPVKMYQPSNEADYLEYALPAPAFYGQHAETLGDLAIKVAADPRFPQCTARRFEAYFTQTQWELVPSARVDELTQLFLDSGLDARELIKAIVLSDEFAVARPEIGEGVSLLNLRPDIYARTLEDLTGLTWFGNSDGPGCEGPKCWGEFEMMLGVRHGYRVLGGGSDGVLIPATIGASPTRVLVYEAIAEDFAGRTTDLDLGGVATPHLLDQVTAATTDEASIRAQLAALHLRVLGERVAPDSEVIDETFALWGAEAAKSDPTTAWKLTLYALFTDPQMWLY